MQNHKLFGVTTDDNYHKEEKTHHFGTQGNCPIALFLVLSSHQKNIIARYFNLFVHTNQANQLQKEVNKNGFVISDLIKDKFNGVDVKKDSILPEKLTPWTFPVFDEEKMNKKLNNPTDIKNSPMLNLNMYSDQFAKHLTMLTADYESNRESTIMTCPISYIEFWGRKEFKDVYPPIEEALNMILKEVAEILTKRGFDVNFHMMTVNLPDYPGFTTVEYYGW